MKFALVSSLFASLATTVSGAGHEAPEMTMDMMPSIADIVVNSTDFTTLLAALELTGLDEALAGTEGPYTVFAPPDAAFEAFMAYSPGTIEKWLAEDPPTSLTEVLLYHVTGGIVPSSALADGAILPMLQGENATLMAEPPMIDASNIIAADVEASNGLIHVIDFPLAPSTVEVLPSIFLAANATGQFTTLWSLIDAVGLGEQLNTPGPLTVFAPTDDAFAKIPNLEEIASDPQLVLAILTNHVVGGFNDAASLSDGQTLSTIVGGTLTVSMDMGSVMINDATVTQADIIGSNGVVHAIDTVLVPSMGPPGTDAPTVTPPEGETEAPTPSAAFGVRGMAAAAAVALVVAALL